MQKSLIKFSDALRRCAFEVTVDLAWPIHRLVAVLSRQPRPTYPDRRSLWARSWQVTDQLP